MQYIDQNSTQLINEGYKIWKKNVPALYNILQTYQLQSCSQTIDWFSESYIDNSWKCMNLLIGTNAISNNAVYQFNIYIPTDQSIVDVSDYKQTLPQNEIGSNGYVGTMGQQRVDIKNTIYQNAEIMKAKISKADKTKQNLIAVKVGGSNPELLIYDLNRQSLQIQNHKISLGGHELQGYGLAWNNIQSSILGSCSYDKQILVYDINSAPSQLTNQIAPIVQFKTSDMLQQIAWSYSNKNIFAVGSQNHQIFLYDLREKQPVLTKTLGIKQIYGIDFNRFSQNLMLTGGEKGDIYLWDIRNMSKKFNSFVGHNDDVTTLKWSNYHETCFMSGSADRKIVVWDINQIESQMTEEQKQQVDRAKQIKFIHNGHRSRITDVCWSEEHNLIGSCEENNTMQVWQMNDGLMGKKNN